MELFENNSRGAVFSDCRNYRYVLWRIWDNELPLIMCIGLNPSTANSDSDDPTIQNLTKMLKRLGYGGFYMTNLFAIISSKPEILSTCKDPLGKNDIYLAKTRMQCKDVLFCWGMFPQAKERGAVVSQMFNNPKCFGINANGSPFHPRALTYIKNGIKEAKLIDYLA